MWFVICFVNLQWINHPPGDLTYRRGVFAALYQVLIAEMLSGRFLKGGLFTRTLFPFCFLSLNSYENAFKMLNNNPEIKISDIIELSSEIIIVI